MVAGCDNESSSIGSAEDSTADMSSVDEQSSSDESGFLSGISEGGAVDSVAESSTSVDEAVPIKEEPPCDFCGQVPCDWVTFADDICDVCDQLKDSGMENNQVRFHAYREYTRLKHGVLHKHDCRPLPICVRSEIIDCWPDPNGNYVGFLAAIKHAAQDSQESN
jgi:hypothetical protein